MKATRASRTVCCATILAAVDRTPPKALPGLSIRRPAVRLRERERERLVPSCGQQGLVANPEAVISSAWKKDSIRSPMVTMPLNAQGRHLYQELQCPRLVESNVMPSASISVPRSEAGLGTAPPWPARPVGKT